MMTGFFWQAVNESSAIAWSVAKEDDGTRTVTGPLGLVVWGSVDWRVLQGLSMSRWSSDRSGHPTWRREDPPSAHEIRRRWRATAGKREAISGPDFTYRSSSGETVVVEAKHGATRAGGQRPPAVPRAAQVSFEPKGVEESVSDFYQRVAAFYSTWLRRNGRPTQTLADAAHVPKTTAARWVNQARQRKYLPPTSRGKSRS